MSSRFMSSRSLRLVMCTGLLAVSLGGVALADSMGTPSPSPKPSSSAMSGHMSGHMMGSPKPSASPNHMSGSMSGHMMMASPKPSPSSKP